MNYWDNLLDKEIQRLSAWITTGYSPRHILLVGMADDRFERQMQTKKITVTWFEKIDAVPAWSEQFCPDLLIVPGQVIGTMGAGAAREQFSDLSVPENLLVAFSLPDIAGAIPRAAKILWEAGFARNFAIDPWVSEQQLIVPFQKHGQDVAAVVGAYEAELWRALQLSENRRRILQEYREDVYAEISTAEFLVKAKDQKIEAWEAFYSSPTGRAIKALIRFRERVLPPTSFPVRLIKFPIRLIRAIRREGLFRFLRAVPMRIRQRINWQKGLWQLRRLQSSKRKNYVEIEPVKAGPECLPHTTSVDIIICVHNALEDVKRCLHSLQEHTSPPYRLILVDDGSGPETRDFLAAFASENEVTLLRNEQASGYTRAANQGLRASSAAFVVLLNSDTILTPCWLDRMICCAQSDPSIGIVGPLSNTASWQSVPRIEQEGDWAENPLPAGLSLEAMGELVADSAAPLYPEMPLLNGFCLMIKRELIDAIGIFDEENFGIGYGEEDDYALRARKAGFRLALADNVYIYHAQSKSYSTERRKMLSERAIKVLKSKHGESIIQEGVEYCHHNRVLEGIRARVAVALDRCETIRQGRVYQGKRILFILPITTPGGGANVVRTESLAMQKMGVEVTFFNLASNRAAFCTAYPNLEIDTIYGEVTDLPYLATQFDAVVATYNPTVSWMAGIQQAHGKPVLGYYVQGYEPLMYPSYSKDYQQAVESYTLLPGLTLFTKTQWTHDMVRKNTGAIARIVGPSLDINLYRPRPRKGPEWPARPLRIAAMIRPEAPYREPYKTMQLLKKISKKYGAGVEIRIMGTKPDNLDFLALQTDFAWNLYGVLPQEKVANFLNEVDIFVDYSSHQAMGLTAMEAMSCGCAVIVPENGGATSFALHEHNSIVVDTTSFDSVYQGVERLIYDDSLRARIQRNAIYDICAFYPERAALNILSVLFGGDQ